MHPSFAWVKPKKQKHKDRIFQALLVRRLQQLRAEHGITQENLIESLHLDISRYETGDSVPSLPSILKLCKFYRITLAEFFAPLDYPPKE